MQESMWYHVVTKATEQAKLVCPTKKGAVAEIQSLLEPVYRKGGGEQGQVHPAPEKRVSWNPAEMSKT
jgi:hypothetical protein